MRASLRRSPSVILALAVVASCRDTASPPKPTSIDILTAATQIAAAGEKVPLTPTFVVKDEQGRAMSGVSVSISVTAGNGILANAPTKTSDGSSTSVGDWSLGPTLGVNQLTIVVAGLAPATITATARPGAAAKIVPLAPLSITGRVGEQVATPPSARITDAFDNAIPSADVSVRLTGGGSVAGTSASSAATTATADAQGVITLAWTLGTVAGQDVLTLTAGKATMSFIADAQPGDPAAVTAVSGDGQSGRAGAALDSPVLLRASDRFGNVITNQSMNFAVTSGNGTLAANVASPTADGLVAVPPWTLGRMAVPQVVRVTVGAVSADVTATVKTDYHIDVRFYGPAMTPEQQALFTNAAARLSAIITGDVPDVPAQPVSLEAFCGVSGLPLLNEALDDVIIYATIQDIDGPGGILAQAGPCAFRNATYGGFAAFGVMRFDAADVATMASRGILQDVITHEMLHVLGIGTAWLPRGLLTGAKTSAATYTGAQGIQGCIDTGGVSACGTGVPVENNGVVGTADSHWRETTFQSELMTGYVNTGAMPLSLITVGALADLGYVVNPLAADPYRVPQGAARSTVDQTSPPWEKPLPIKGSILP